MDRVSSSSFIVYCAILGLVVANFAATQNNVHVVGDSLGWTVPPNTSVYDNWASGKTFMLGDILVFNFMANEHDVVQVPQASYTDCSDDNAIGSTFNAAVNITLDSVGDRHYICSVGRHCIAGQKLSITVVSSSSPSPPGVATPPTTTPLATPTTPSPRASPQPDDCAPTPSQSPKADGPTTRVMPPPPPPPFNAASISQASTFLLVIMSGVVALVF